MHTCESVGIGSRPWWLLQDAATAAAFLRVLYPRSGWISRPIVALGGFAPMYVGAHYVTDVSDRWLVGGLLGAGAVWLLLQWPRF